MAYLGSGAAPQATSVGANAVGTSAIQDGAVTSPKSALTKSDVGLGNVTNDAQTKAAVVPNTLTANNVILGNGASAVQFVAPGASGNLLTSNGTTWTSAAASGYAGTRSTVYTTGTGTFTIPTGITQLKVTVVGGGGAGGGVGSGACTSFASGGGGGGGASIVWLTGLTSGNTISYAVGAAGTAGTGNGGTGGTSSISSGTQTITTVSATGGAGGYAGVTGAKYNSGGNGGAGSSGTLNTTGGQGINGFLDVSQVILTSGAGGSSILSGGANGVRRLVSSTGSDVGVAGVLGAGGSGALTNNNTTTRNGGSGGAGCVIFEY